MLVEASLTTLHQWRKGDKEEGKRSKEKKEGRMRYEAKKRIREKSVPRTCSLPSSLSLARIYTEAPRHILVTGDAGRGRQAGWQAGWQLPRVVPTSAGTRCGPPLSSHPKRRDGGVAWPGAMARRS
ncbi:hypothetical protein E2C01_015584 [Portunus trituberculatus]|uniref:Uncharacterized protein n=1 Tax=Portunus trituberculatus TaxID=210409 RepID=A0A5B7DN68_PORTR|nr:hypothetical protein [Portunus trituberculatus]